jgi:hypothetical protein
LQRSRRAGLYFPSPRASSSCWSLTIVVSSRDEDANFALALLFQPGTPHGCLSDTRLTGKHERCRELAVEKGGDGGEFLFSPDDRGERGGHDKVDYATSRRGDLIRSPEASSR